MSAAHHTPCPSCPYRKDCPSGIWHHQEYEKLRTYDSNSWGAFAKFMCHTEKSKLCRGWVSVHCESVAVRLCMARKEITADEVYATPPLSLFASGNAAANHGQKHITRPNKAAQKMIGRLLKQKLAKI